MADQRNTSNEILQLVDNIAFHASKNEKQALVARYGEDEGFRKVLTLAYNPFITFGIKAVPVQEEGALALEQFNDDTWLLLDRLAKRDLTGNAARQAVQTEMNLLTKESAELLKRILKKDLRAGFSESTINKALGGIIPEFPYMRCSLLKHIKVSDIPFADGVFSQLKADGMFANISHEAGGLVSITSRQGTPFPEEPFAQFCEEFAKHMRPNTQTHGEFLVLRDGKVLAREIGNGVLNSVLKGGSFAENEKPLLLVWDQIPLEAVMPKGRYAAPYRVRFADLTNQVIDEGASRLLGETTPFSPLIQMIPTRIVRSMDDAMAHYREVLADGKEGTVLKFPEAIWRDGDSKEQIKLKLEVDVDLEIVGFLPGNGKNAATFGSVLCRTSCEQLEVAVSGFSDKDRLAIHRRRDEVLGMVMTIKANSIMPPARSGIYSLFLPRHVEIRSDKSVADDLARVIAQFEAAIRGDAVLS